MFNDHNLRKLDSGVVVPNDYSQFERIKEQRHLNKTLDELLNRINSLEERLSCLEQ